MNVELDNMSGYRYEIWFPYTQDMMAIVKPGDLVAVPNFDTRSGKNRQTVLEIIQVVPRHFALASDLDSVYPGFIDQAAESASEDWTTQVDKPSEHTTKIRCVAIPTDIEVSFEANKEDGQVIIHSGAQMPMPGREARILASSLIERIYNQNISGSGTIELGTLTRDSTVPIVARLEDLIKTHIGVFGYTGTGKSNFLSSLISSLLDQKQETIKIVVYDLMGEYSGLLLDRLVDKSANQIVRYIVIGEESLPGPVVDYLKGDNRQIGKATTALLNHLLLPKGLKARKKEFEPAVRNLLESKRINFYLRIGGETIGALYESSPVAEFIKNGRRNATQREKLRQWVMRAIGEKMNSSVTAKLAGEVAEALSDKLDDLSDMEDATEAAKLLINTFRTKAKSKETSAIPQTYVPRIVGELNNEDRSSIYIVTAAQPDALRVFSHSLCMAMYNSRRETGSISPLVLFVFDEADEFIPQNPKETYATSSEAVETIARRGRKFGMGVCIATQRIAYLDTSILAQPHTYFVSRLPRKYDRDTVTSAFGMSEEMMRETFRFGKGDWLVVSHDATGLQSIPIPVHAPNAEDRIKNNLLSKVTE